VLDLWKEDYIVVVFIVAVAATVFLLLLLPSTGFNAAYASALWPHYVHTTIRLHVAHMLYKSIHMFVHLCALCFYELYG